MTLLLEKLALIYLLGTTALTLQMFAYSLIGIRFGFAVIAAPWLLIAPPLFLYLKNTKIRMPALSNIEQLIAAVIGLKVLYVFFQALIKPVAGWDSIWNFSLRAKIFFFERTIPLDRSAQFFLGGGMRQYPMQIPLLETFAFLSLNSWDDVRMKVIFPLYFVSLLALFYSSMRKEKGRAQSLFFTFLLSSLPMLTYHATIEYADFVAGTYFMGAAAFLYRYFNGKRTSDLVISSLLIGACSWVKDEGTVFYLILFLILLLFNRLREPKPLIIYLVPFLAVTTPWLIFKRVMGLTLGNDPNFRIFGDFLVFRPEVIGKIADKTFLNGNWHLLPLAMIVLIVFYWNDIMSTNRKYLLLASSLAWGFFMSLYLFTPNAGFIMTDIILSRNYLTYFPLCMLLLGLAFDFAEKKKEEVRSSGKASKGRKKRS